MIVRKLDEQVAFTTMDGSTIREILNQGNAPVGRQSLAEAVVWAGGSTQRHHHKRSEEIYFILEGNGRMDIEGETREVGPGDAVLIPPGAWHRISALTDLRFLCCCSPPYEHADTFFQDGWISAETA